MPELGPEKYILTLLLQLADMVAARAQAGKNYGVVLVPEGLIECVPEVRSRILWKGMRHDDGRLDAQPAVGGEAGAAAVEMQPEPEPLSQTSR